MPHVLRWIPAGWALLLGVVMLGPALAPGLVMSYDMVWVPDLALRPDTLGLGSALPRAVPSDAVVAVLDEVVPGAWLQKLVLLGSLVAAGTGAARLVGHLSLPARLVAVTVMVWNPFVAERLAIGHWPVLVGYAVLPWLVVVASEPRRGRVPWMLGPLVVLGSLSASTGVATAVAVLATVRREQRARVLVLLLAANAPWLASGLLHGDTATSDPDGAFAFATSGEGLLPAPLAALGLGGIWNSEVVPQSRNGWLGVTALVLLVLLAVAGRRRWWSTTPPVERRAYVVCWAVGMGVALLSWAAPGLVATLAASVPGGGLLRDGSRLLALAAPLTAVLAAHGAARVADATPDRITGVVLATGLALSPVTLMPDAAGGVQGRLTAVTLPSALERVGPAVDDRVHRGDVVVLPFTSYRAPAWNGHRKVLDPVPRLLPRDVVTSDTLRVSGQTIEGEDPRASDIARALQHADPSARAAALAELGIGAVVSGPVPGQQVPEVAGTVVWERDGVRVVRLDDVDERGTPTTWVVAMGIAWLLWLGALVAPPGRHLARELRRAGVQGGRSDLHDS